MARKNSSRRVRTNHAQRPLSPEEQRAALNRITFGESWENFLKEIDTQLVEYKPDDTIRQSTSRALQMIKDMAYDRL